jgi:hypothetical protein
MGVITKEYTFEEIREKQNKQLNINNTSEWSYKTQNNII